MSGAAATRQQGGAFVHVLRRVGLAGPLEYVGQAAHGLAHPELLKANTTREERSEPLPGDEIVAVPIWAATRGETIDVAADELWPWLLQMGWGRGGWYAWFPFAHPHQLIERLHPTFAHVAAGDVLLDGPDCDPGVGAWRVAALAPERYLVLHSRQTLGKGSERKQAGRGPWIDSSWAFVLRSLGPNTTRLLVRTRVALTPAWIFGLLRPLFVPGDTVMQRTMLHCIKLGAERVFRREEERLVLPRDRFRRLARWSHPVYRLGLGRFLGARFILIEHRGRHSGQIRQTCVMPMRVDRSTHAVTVVGDPSSDWVRNVLATPAIRVTIGSFGYEPVHRVLDVPEIEEVLRTMRWRHPFRSRIQRWFLGWPQADGPADIQRLARSLTGFEFRPSSTASTRGHRIRVSLGHGSST